MHAAAMGDTLGIALVLIGLMIFSGLNFGTLKMLCIIMFLWFSWPTASHLIARLEITTNEDKEKNNEIILWSNHIDNYLYVNYPFLSHR